MVDVVEDTATVLALLDNDIDIDGDVLTVVAVTQPDQGGSVALVGGVVTFTPAPDFNGPVTFTYTVSDGQRTDTATVTPRQHRLR